MASSLNSGISLGNSLQNSIAYLGCSQDMSEPLSTHNAPVYIAISITEIVDCTLISTKKTTTKYLTYS